MSSSLEGSVHAVCMPQGRRLSYLLSNARFRHVHPLVRAKNFPIKASCADSVQVQLMPAAGARNSRAVAAAMRRNGMRPATIAELLALAAKRPYLRTARLVVALGSQWRGPDGVVRVAAFTGISERRLLLIKLSRPEYFWTSRDLFVGVANTSKHGTT